MGLGIRGEAVQEETATELLARLSLADRMHAKPARLSGGQRQRVAVARAIVNKPRLILADEPTAALDAASGRTVIELLKQRCEELRGVTIIVTHDQRVIDLADRIVSLVDGRIGSDVVVSESLLICEFLRKVELFSELSPADLLEVAEGMQLDHFAAGAAVVRQGEEGHDFFLIRDGSVKVVVDDGTEQRTVGTLGVGDFFGERALITGEPRNASVIAEGDLDVYSLDKEEFQRAREASSSFEEQVLGVLFQR